MVVITGASGLLGSRLVKECQARAIPFRALFRNRRRAVMNKMGVDESSLYEADILDMPALLNAFEGATVVIHCAARVSFNPGEKKKIFSSNVEGTHNVVNACLRQGVPRLIHISSVAAFGRQKNARVVNEGTRWITELKQSDYGTSKYLAELEVYRGMEEGLQVAIINPSLILDAADGVRSSSRFFSYAWGEKPFYTDYPVSYVDVRDVAEIIFRVMNKNGNGEKYIANTGQVGLGVLLADIAKRLNKRPPRIKIPDSVLDVYAFAEYLRHLITGARPALTPQSVKALRELTVYDNAKAVKELGMVFRPLEDTLDWCCTEFLNFTTNK